MLYYFTASSPNFGEKLSSWVVQSKTLRMHVNELLKILHEYHPELPFDSRTLVSTRKITLRVVEPGNYFHFGVAKGVLLRTLNQLKKKSMD